MYGLHSLPMPPFDPGEFASRSPRAYHHHSALNLDFSQFDGENPRVSRLKCEVYFSVYATRSELWVSVATMHFVGNAVLWLQSTRAHTVCTSWEEFAETVCARFGREEFRQ